jgi:hypothetical protein
MFGIIEENPGLKLSNSILDVTKLILNIVLVFLCKILFLCLWKNPRNTYQKKILKYCVVVIFRNKSIPSLRCFNDRLEMFKTVLNITSFCSGIKKK